MTAAATARGGVGSGCRRLFAAALRNVSRVCCGEVLVQFKDGRASLGVAG
ncbi:hypothetical protein [Xanthomonas cannabis]|nr:hypothetical protein [Xanthomonas cannabis]NIK18823.1 hypothetical protein [Xanthomonas cannabis]